MKKEPWLIAACRYCLEKSETGVKHSELKKHLLGLGYCLDDYQIQQFFEEEITHPGGRQYSRLGIKRPPNEENTWQPPLSLIQTITDHDELTFARKTSQEASQYAKISIVIALMALFASITIPIFYTQTVRIEQSKMEQK